MKNRRSFPLHRQGHILKGFGGPGPQGSLKGREKTEEKGKGKKREKEKRGKEREKERIRRGQNRETEIEER